MSVSSVNCQCQVLWIDFCILRLSKLPVAGVRTLVWIAAAKLLRETWRSVRMAIPSNFQAALIGGGSVKTRIDFLAQRNKKCDDGLEQNHSAGVLDADLFVKEGGKGIV
jgi:hypothetical protein